MIDKLIFGTDIYIRVFHQLDEHDPFITAVSGNLTIENLETIEKELTANQPENSGEYIYSVTFQEAQLGEFGMIEIASYWETTEVSYSPF